MEIRYYGDKLSERIAKTPEGFLICQDVPISRTGYQEYLAKELTDNPLNGDKIVPVYRPAKEVFDIRSLASFEGKPVTNEHPDEDVTPENYQQYSCGHVQNVHVGDGEDSNKVLADLYITDPTLIHLIQNGKREISCGYYAEEVKDSEGRLCQTKIRGNHVAVVRSGRAGKRVCIRDSKKPRIKIHKKALSDYIDGLRYLHTDYGVKGMKKGQHVKAKSEEYLKRLKNIGSNASTKAKEAINSSTSSLINAKRRMNNKYASKIRNAQNAITNRVKRATGAATNNVGNAKAANNTASHLYNVKIAQGSGIKVNPKITGGVSNTNNIKHVSTKKPVRFNKKALAAGGAAALLGGGAYLYSKLKNKDSLYNDAGIKGMKRGQHIKARDPEYLKRLKGGNGVAIKKATPNQSLARLRKSGKHSAAKSAVKTTKPAASASSAVSSASKAASRARKLNELKYYGSLAAGRGLRHLPKLGMGVAGLLAGDYVAGKLRGKDSLPQDINRLFGNSRKHNSMLLENKGDAMKYYYDDDEVLMDDDEVLEDDDEVLMDDDEIIEDEDEILEDDDEVLMDDDEVVYEDDDEILEDDDEEVLMDDDELLEDDELVYEDDDEEVLMDDDELLEDDDIVYEDDDEILEDDDEIYEDDDELLEANTVVKDARSVIADAKYALRKIKRNLKRIKDSEIINDDEELKIEDEDEILEDGCRYEDEEDVLLDDDELLEDDDFVYEDDDEILEDDDEEVLMDDDELLEDDDDVLLDDDEILEDDDEVLMDDDEIIEDEDEILEDDDEILMDDDVLVTEKEEVVPEHPESEVIDADKTAALRQITEASRGITNPVERKQLQDAIYKALCGKKNQMADVMRITKKARKAKLDAAANSKGKVDINQQQSIYDSFNPHKKTSF